MMFEWWFHCVFCISKHGYAYQNCLSMTNVNKFTWLLGHLEWKFFLCWDFWGLFTRVLSGHLSNFPENFSFLHFLPGWTLMFLGYEWRSGSVSALPCERPWFASRIRLREIIPANNCTMQGQNNWGIGAPRVWWSSEWHGRCFVDQWSSGSYVAEVFIRSWLRHPTTVSSMWTIPQRVKNSKRH